MKKNALLLLMLLVTALTATALCVSLYAFRAQGALIDSMLSSYVLDLAESFAEPRVAPPGGPGRNRMADDIHHVPRRRFFLRMFSADPTLNAGGVLLFDRDGEMTGGSEGAENLAPLWRDGLVSGEPAQVRDARGKVYYAVARPRSNGGNVLVAVSKTNLLGSISRLWNYWLFSVMASSAAVLVGIIALWRYLVLPIRVIVEAVDGARWGEDVPQMPPAVLYEVRALSGVIAKSAEDAVADERMRVRYVSDIVQVQEDARRRMARELHDGPLQAVVAAIKRIQLALREAAGGVREELDEAERISQYAANEIRNYCDELSPSWLALGLSSALEEVAGRLSAVYDIEIAVEADEADAAYDDLPEETSLALVRILQEAASNSVRHGHATKVWVRVSRRDGDLLFEVADNGSGIGKIAPADYERLRLDGHRGLSNMFERVQLLRGEIEIGPGEGLGGETGCRIWVRIPETR